MSTPTDSAAIAAAIAAYLRSGTTDPLVSAWRGDLHEKAERSQSDLREALVSETRRLAAGRSHPPMPSHDLSELTRREVMSIVVGPFPAA